MFKCVRLSVPVMVDDDSRWYPEKIWAGEFAGKYSKPSIDFLFSDECDLSSMDKSSITIAEIGIWKGGTSFQLAKFLDGKGELHLFDYQDIVDETAKNLNDVGFSNIVSWGSSYKYLDSYNWTLMKLMERSTEPIFDFIYMDGAHTWAIDALTFFLCDKLLKPGGYLDFDDYHWTLRNSSLDPLKIPETALLYTDEQIDSKQVKLIVDLLVKRNDGYKQVIENRIYQKIA